MTLSHPFVLICVISLPSGNLSRKLPAFRKQYRIKANLAKFILTKKRV